MKKVTSLLLFAIAFASSALAWDYSRTISPAGLSGEDFINTWNYGEYDNYISSADVYSYIYQDGGYITGYVAVYTYDGASQNPFPIIATFSAYIDVNSHVYFDWLEYDYGPNVYWFYGTSGDLLYEALQDLETQLSNHLGT
jgi:hypothetical protein